MFTGIIQAKGRVAALTPNDFGVRLLVDPGRPDTWAAQGMWPAAGDSVAVNGCCLTVAPQPADGQDRLGFDVIKETLDKTSLGRLKPGAGVNLELSLTPTTPIGGHLVQGHVDGTGTIRRVIATAEQRVLTIEAPRGLLTCIVPKGSVSVDGVSLTIARVDTEAPTFDVALIPTTLEQTTLGEAKEGDLVNLETDMIARTVVHWLELRHGNGDGEDQITVDLLRRAGFVE